MASSANQHFSTLFPAPVSILDGGMGTTLQSPPFSLPLDSVLWSSALLGTEEGKEKLELLARTFIEAGASIIGSCTYQSSLPLFLEAIKAPSESYTLENIASALSTMISAIPIVTKTYSCPHPSPIHSCLSLGPFGAQCSPGQEYGGLYPPPFGISSPSKLAYSPLAGLAAPLDLFSVIQSTNPEEDHLTAFHLERLLQFSKSEAFEKLSIIGFETVPVLEEVRAIRRAMGLFEKKSGISKPCISYVFPANSAGQPEYPDLTQKSNSLENTIINLIGTTFLSLPPTLPISTLEASPIATPTAIGINCTNPSFLPTLVTLFASTIASFNLSTAPYLILYPDGGAVYDTITRSWSTGALEDLEWAKKVTEGIRIGLEARTEKGEKIFGGVIAGGCCKAGPSAIRALREECGKLGWLGEEGGK